MIEVYSSFGIWHVFLYSINTDKNENTYHFCSMKYRCPSLSCPLDSLPPRGQANRGWLTPRGASYPGISCPPPWLSSPPGGKLSRPVYLAPRLTQVKIYTCYFVIFLYHFNEFRSSISHKVRNWCLWG